MIEYARGPGRKSVPLRCCYSRLVTAVLPTIAAMYPLLKSEDAGDGRSDHMSGYCQGPPGGRLRRAGAGARRRVVHRTAPTALLVPVDSLHALQLCCICRLRDAPVPVHHVRPDRGGRAGRCTCSSRCCYHARSARSTELMNQGLFITTCLMLAQFM
jgi:hypothetical protein